MKELTPSDCFEFTIKLKAPRCQTHKRYGVKLKPRTNCEACWFLWVYKVTNKFLFNC